MPLGDERRSKKGPDGSIFFHFQFNKNAGRSRLCKIWKSKNRKVVIIWCKALQTKGYSGRMQGLRE